MHPSVCLSAFLPFCLFVCLSVGLCLSVHMSIFLSGRPLICLSCSVYLSAYVSLQVSLPFRLYICIIFYQWSRCGKKRRARATSIQSVCVPECPFFAEEAELKTPPKKLILEDETSSMKIWTASSTKYLRCGMLRWFACCRRLHPRRRKASYPKWPKTRPLRTFQRM